ncbi:EAL domain-containing protein [Paramagnetospirillum kuznetsovii]|nr:EAL domain-containing protein [Paramagnetospirillum kuznetsovii]
MMNVLVVEDSKFFASVLRKAIEDRLGFRMVLAASRADARLALKEHKGSFFAALVDLHLPDSNEGEVVDDVSANNIPVIVFTGDFNDDMREMVLSRNVVDYVTKNNPGSIEYVLAMLRRLSTNASATVLVVDDSKTSRMQFTRLLQNHNFKVVEANGGEEALKVLAAHPEIRLAIIDYHMDGMDGCRLTEDIRKTRSRDKMVIIGISAYGSNVLSARFMKSGASDFINKPFIPEELFCRIYQNLDFIDQIESLTRVGISLASARQEAERDWSGDLASNPAYYDQVTALPNRRLFIDRLGVAMATARRTSDKVALLLFDLDLFKRINDSLGHAAGDGVLVEIASRLTSCVREGDTVARIGGDEFAMILPQATDIDAVAKFAERAVSMIRTPFEVDGRDLFVTASVGGAVFPDDGGDLEALIQRAETAMYRAKDGGRDAFQLYAPAMNARSMELLSLESELRRAVDRSEFRLVYQGKVDMESGQLTGVEALIRWQHPTLGAIAPNDFIPMAESLGLISTIGTWVLREACRQAMEWRGKGLPPLCVSVNVSPRQFRDCDVAEIVAETLATSGLEPHNLELEITESLLMQRVDEVASVLRDLRAIGVKVSVDDFGTGYSSLSYLSRMPLDALKIDRTFVTDIPDAEDAAEIVGTIINLAHSLKLKAVAEGVETVAQAMFLHQKGCDQVQGFLVARPMAPAELISLMDRRLLSII